MLFLVLAHVVFNTVGYALLDRISIPNEVSVLLSTYPDMVAATIGTVLSLLVVVASLVIVRRRLRYEIWYLVHLTAYAAIALAWVHQIPTGNEFSTSAPAAAYWTSLYLTTLVLLVVFRIVRPIVQAFRYRLRVAEVTVECSNVISLRLTGRHLHHLHARAGQFFLWRFLTWNRFWESHPFSLSEVPDGQSLRITVKNVGDFTRHMGEIQPGTAVIAEGPFGAFTEAVRQRERAVLIAGGIGITPIRALPVIVASATATSSGTTTIPTAGSSCRLSICASLSPTSRSGRSTSKAKKYKGPAVNMRWGPVQVTIAVKGKKITNISATAPMERSRSDFINGQALPLLKSGSPSGAKR